MMPRVVTASLLALIIYPNVVSAQGTRLWVQSRYEEFAKGQPETIAISSRGYLEAGPTLKSVFLTPSTYIWDVASDSQGNAYLATGSPATVLKVTSAGVSTKLFSTKELTVQAVRVGPDGSVYAATVPGGKVYRIKPDQSGLDESSDFIGISFRIVELNSLLSTLPPGAGGGEGAFPRTRGVARYTPIGEVAPWVRRAPCGIVDGSGEVHRPHTNRSIP